MDEGSGSVTQGATGWRVGSFELLDELGRGGMAEVWRAAYRCPEVLTSGQALPRAAERAEAVEPQLVALKVLTTARARREAYVSAVQREVRAIARLDHPHVLVVLDQGQISPESARASGGRLVAGSPWLAMELASSGSLRPHRGKMPWPQLRGVLLELLEALAHAHARGVLHRDIKPANVLFGAWGGGVKLADFGVAHPLHGHETDSSEGWAAGTPAYMAPEQFEGRACDFGPWTDLYGLGCLAFEMASGHKPYPATKNFATAAQAHLTWPLPVLSPATAVPSHFEAWLHRLLAKEGYHRYQLAADAAHDLRRLGDPEVIAPSLDGPGASADARGSGGGESSRDSPTLTEPDDTRPTRTAPDDTRPTRTATTSPMAESLQSQTDPAATAAAELLFPRADQSMATRPAERPPMPSSTHLVGAGLGLYGLRTVPFFARDKERDALWDALRKVSEGGRAEVVVLTGNAGTGKSRLAQWLTERAHEAGVARSVRVEHGPDAGATSGLVPMVERLFRCQGLSRAQVLRRVMRRCRPDTGEEADDDISAIVSLLRPARRPREVGPSIWMDAPDARYATISRALALATHRRPLVVWLDDVHWAPDALSFVNYLLRSQDQQPVAALVIMTARQEELAMRSTERALLDEVLAAPHAVRHEIGPLPDAVRGPFIEQVLGLRGDLAARVRVRTAGNPSFAVQLMGDWVARGILESSSSGFHLRTGADVQLPDDVYAIWSRRVSSLFADRPVQLRALEIAAISGRRVDEKEWLLACTKLRIAPEKEIRPLLRSLVQELAERGLAEKHGRSGWSFVHGMLHESLERGAREVAGPQRLAWARLHQTAAEVLQDRATSEHREPPPGRLGRHLLEGDRPSLAIAPLLQSVRDLLARGELASAQVSVAWLSRALDAADAQSCSPIRIEAALLEAQMARQQGRIDAASERLAFAEAAARQHEDSPWLTEILCEGSIVAYRAGQLDVAVSRSHEGEALAVQNTPLLVACCLEVRGRSFTDRGELQQAQRCFDDALSIYRDAGVFRGMASCQLGLGWVAMTQGALPVAHRQIEEARATCEDRQLRMLSGVCMNMLGEIERQRGRLAESQRCYREAVRRHQSCGALATSMIAELNLALVHLESDEFVQARSLASAVNQSIQVSGARQFLAAVHLILLVCAAAAERWADWSKHFEAARTLLHESGQVHGDLATLAQRAARMARDAGHAQRASEAFGLAEQQWRRLGDEPSAERAKEEEASVS